MVELVDTSDLGSGGEIRASSSLVISILGGVFVGVSKTEKIDLLHMMRDFNIDVRIIEDMRVILEDCSSELEYSKVHRVVKKCVICKLDNYSLLDIFKEYEKSKKTWLGEEFSTSWEEVE